MKTLEIIIREAFDLAINNAFPSLATREGEAEVTQSTQDKFGDYQCNSAMKLAKGLRMPPRQVAEAIIDQVRSHPDAAMFNKLEVAGPGFINISLSNGCLAERMMAMTQGSHLGIPLPSTPQRIVIDFCSPNTAKDMHVGHLRSAIIGDCLARLFEFLGHDVLRLNHIGDWGTSFGMLIAFLKETHPQIIQEETKTDLLTLEDWYREAKARFDADPEFRLRSQQQVVALQGGDADALRAWELICAITRKGHQEILDLLGISLIERGESFYNKDLPGVVTDLEEKGLIVVSGGAKCVFLDGFKNREGEPLPFIIQKSDGGYNYATTDLAALKHRVSQEHAERIIILTDAGQASHFAMLFQVGALAGYYDPHCVRLDHVPFGLVLGEDGKKFRTRSGNVEKLRDLLDTAVSKAKEVSLQRADGKEINSEELDKLGHILGIGAVKYADLSCMRLGDYQFNYDRMLRFDGNTAIFLLYVYVRIAGIKRRVGCDVEALFGHTEITLDHPSERALALHLCRFAEALQAVVDDLMPHHLTEYLYQLAESFNAFFRDCRVEGTAEQGSRLVLCELVARTMKAGLNMLGLQTIDRM